MGDYNYLFVSDFHVAMGKTDASRPAYHPREDFFYDEAFVRFLDWADKHPVGNKKWELVFNGDCFDFWPVDALIMKEIPNWDEDDWRQVGYKPTEDWSEKLHSLPNLADEIPVEGQSTVAERAAAIRAVSRQIRYQRIDPTLIWHRSFDVREEANAERGISVKKLNYIRRGHPHFFEALGRWTAAGHKLVMMRGNHDLDIYWDEVQEAFKNYVYVDYKIAVGQMNADPLEFDEFAKNIDFSHPWFYYRPGVFYAEHGSQYEPANSTPNFLNPVNNKENGNLESNAIKLNQPLGSLIVQYLLSPLEDRFPELENRGSYVQFIFNLIVDEPDKVVRILARSLLSFYRATRKLWEESKDTSDPPSEDDLEDYADNAGLPLTLVTELYDTGAKPLLAYRRLTFFLFNWWIQLLMLLLVLAIAIGLLWFYFARFLPQLNEEIAFFTKWFAERFTSTTLAVSRQEFSTNATLLTQVVSGIALVLGRIPIKDWFSRFVGWLWKLISKLTMGGLKVFDTHNYLFKASEEIAVLFDSNIGNLAPIFYIFGHDHHPDSRRIEGVKKKSYYLNTGAWLPEFDEGTRRLRTDGTDVEFTFLKIWESKGEYVHSLLKWNDQAERADLQIVPPDKMKDPHSNITQTVMTGVLLGAIVGVWLKQLIISLLIFSVLGYFIGYLWNQTEEINREENR